MDLTNLPYFFTSPILPRESEKRSYKTPYTASS